MCGRGMRKGRGKDNTSSRRRLISSARTAVSYVCYWSIALTSCATSMADTDIDVIRKQKKAERNKRYRLKRKMEMQQQASTTSQTELAKSKRRKSEYDKQHQLKRKIEMQQSEIEVEIPKTYT